MDNSTGKGIEESANIQNVDDKYPDFDKKSNSNEKIKQIVGHDVETIIVPTGVQDTEANPNLVETKTEVCTQTVDESLIQNISNKDQELCDNVQQLNLLEDQDKNPNQIPADKVAVQKVNISESLSNLLVYGSSSEDSEVDSASSIAESDTDTDDNQCSNNLESEACDGLSTSVKSSELCMSSEDYREKKEDSSDSSDNESSDSGSFMGAKNIKQQSKSLNNTEGELGFEDLPPVPDLSKLNINLKEGECVQMGNVTSIVDRLVMVQSLPNMPAYDLDTLLFLDEGKQPLGHVYDVMGQVTSPMYVIRFNSKQEIESKGISKGLPIYSAPNTEHTQYVFLKELMKIKGTDASWKDDSEVPVEFVDFSDDEAEYTFSKQHLNEKDIFDKKRKRNSIERHKMFETAMNLKNKVDTARHKMRDSYEPTPKRYMPQNNQPTFYFHPPNINQIRQQCSTSYTNFPPPNFTMPPPNFGFMSIGPAMLGMQPYSTQFGHGISPFPPNSQPFVPPAIPPLPVPHVLPQPPPPAAFPTSMSVIPPNVAIMNMPKPTNTPKPSKPLKSNQNGGVVPKTHSALPKPRNGSMPKLYMPSPSDYQPPYPPSLGLPKATIPPFNTNTPQNMPTSIPPSFCPPMPPWPFNMARPPHNRGFQPHYSGAGRPFQKQ